MFGFLSFRWSIGLAAVALPWAFALHQVPAPQKPQAPDVFAEGLAAWRRPGGKFNSACSSCHAPDAFDIAQFNFDDDTIRRRALAHVDAADANKIIALVHAVREKYQLKPLDPMLDRPLQPGGLVLPGATPADRDLAFGQSLSSVLPTLMTDRIDSLQKAKKARDEILAVDVRNLRIGIPFNRWSEDIFHGDEHGMIGDWLADVPCAPDPTKQAQWFQLVDQYITNPTDQTFWPVYNAVAEDTKPYANMSFANDLAYRKYQSMLIAQHVMREKALNSGGGKPLGTTQFSNLGNDTVPNPFWQVGEYAVLNEGFDSDTQGVPQEVLKDLDSKRAFGDQMRAMEVPWMWIGWMSDQGLQRTPGDQSTHNGRYFTLSLYTNGDYALHNCFMITRKQLVQSFDPAALPSGRTQRFILDYSEFAAHRNVIRYEPQEPERQAMFRKMTGNAFRMSLYLLMNDARRTGVVASKAIDEFQLQAIREYLIYSDPEHKAENVKLADDCLDVVEGCRDANSR